MPLLKKNGNVTKDDLDEGQKNNLRLLEGLIDDLSIDVIGLEGEWGSGKSAILSALKEDRDNCFEYDLWAHQEDNLRYSFLKGLLEYFKPEEIQRSDAEKVPKYADLEKEVDDLVSSRKESSPKVNIKMAGMIFVLVLLPVLAKIADSVWDKKPLFYTVSTLCIPMVVLSFLYLFSTKKDKPTSLLERQTIHAILFRVAVVALGVVGLIYSENNLFLNSLMMCALLAYVCFPLKDFYCYFCKTSAHPKRLFALFVVFFVFVVIDVFIGVKGSEEDIALFVFGEGGVSFKAFLLQVVVVVLQIFFIAGFIFVVRMRFSNILKNEFVSQALTIYNDKLVETSYSTDIQPRMEDVLKFMNKFEGYLEKKGFVKNGKYVIIFDNLDRLPSEKIKEFWTFLQTFFVEKNDKKRTVIVAFDRAKVVEAFDSVEIGEGYLEKSLDISLHIPLCSRVEKREFFLKQWTRFFLKPEMAQEMEDFFNSSEANMVSTGKMIFDIYYQLSIRDASVKPVPEETADIFSRRKIVETINNILLKRKIINLLFPENVVDELDEEKPKIENPFEMITFFIVREATLINMFSERIKIDGKVNYIDAYDDCLEWVSCFIPGSGEEKKKRYFNIFCDKIIRNVQKNDVVTDDSLKGFCKRGRLQQYCTWAGVNDLKSNFDYMRMAVVCDVKNDIDVLNFVKSLLYCVKDQKIELSGEKLTSAWEHLYEKMKRLEIWPKEAWLWNSFLSNSKAYLEETECPDDYAFFEKREFFVVDALRLHFIPEDNQHSEERKLNGKICLSKMYFDVYSFNDLPRHDIEKEGKVFFYEGDEQLVLKQLNKFSISDWERSLENFWNPGVIQYDNLTDEYKSKCKLDKFDKAVKRFFENYMNVKKHRSYQEQLDLIHFDDCYRWGPLGKDVYFEKWNWIIRRMEKEDFAQMFDVPNRSVYFPNEMKKIIDEIGVERGIW